VCGNLGGPTATTAYREKAVCSKTKPIGTDVVKDENGNPVRDSNWNVVTKPILATVHYCPKCGTTNADRRGVPLSPRELTNAKKVTQKSCKAVYFKSLYNTDKPNIPGGEVLMPAPERHAGKKPGTEVNHDGKKWVVRECGERLFNYTSNPFRWAPARVIQKKLNPFFKYLIIDEVHEPKSDESARSMACSKLIGAVDHVLALTKTIIGGYAHHLYPLRMRITPASLRAEAFEWGSHEAFAKIYGRIDTIVTTTEKDDSVNVTGRTTSMRNAKSGSTTTRTQIKPGVMPTMFARHMLGTSIFITVEELAKSLSERIDESDLQRKWSKANSGTTKRKALSALDSLTPEVQAEIVAATAAQLVAEMLEESPDDWEDARVEAKVPAIESVREEHGFNESDVLADEEWEDATVEKELDDETGDEREPEPQPAPKLPRASLARPERKPEPEERRLRIFEPGNGSRVGFGSRQEQAGRVAKQNSVRIATGPVDEPEDEDEPEDVPTLQLVSLDPPDDPDKDEDWEYDPDEDDFEINPEILAKTFQNLHDKSNQ
jgi:hypothetical protein